MASSIAYRADKARSGGKKKETPRTPEAEPDSFNQSELRRRHNGTLSDRAAVLLNLRVGLIAWLAVGLTASNLSEVLLAAGVLDPPPMKWSALWYGFEPGGRIDVEEATQA